MTTATAPVTETNQPPPDIKPNGKGTALIKPAELDALMRKAARMEEAEDIAHDVSDKELVMLEKQGEYKRAKKDYEGAVDRLIECVNDPNDLLFGPTGDAPKPKTETGTFKGLEIADALAAFEKTKLADLGIKGKLLDTLLADGIKTGKELAEFLYTFPPRKLNGVGDSARNKLDDACQNFYDKRQKERETLATYGREEGNAKLATAKTQPRDKSGKAKRFSGNKHLKKGNP